PEHDALLELLGDAFGDQLCIDFGLAHFFDVDSDGHAETARQFSLEVLDVLALLADHDARTGRENRDACVLGGALDEDAGDRGAPQTRLEVFAYLQVFSKHRREVLVRRIPTRRPVARDGKAETN